MRALKQATLGELGIVLNGQAQNAPDVNVEPKYHLTYPPVSAFSTHYILCYWTSQADDIFLVYRFTLRKVIAPSSIRRMEA